MECQCFIETPPGHCLLLLQFLVSYCINKRISDGQSLPSSLYMIVTTDLFSGMWTQNLKDDWNKTENNANNEKKTESQTHIDTRDVMRENNDTSRWRKLQHCMYCCVLMCIRCIESLGKFTQKHRSIAPYYYMYRKDRKKSVAGSLHANERMRKKNSSKWNENQILVVFTV